MSEHEDLIAVPPPPANLAPEEIVVANPPSRRPAAYVAIVVGLIAMVGGAVFFSRSLGSNEGGADTPVAAVQRMFDALSDQDALGVLETLLPSERDQLRGPLQDITRELGRIGILSKDLDLGSISGIELNFTGLKFATDQIAPGVNTVTLEAGTSTYTIDPAHSPLGSFVRGLLPAEARNVIKGNDDLSKDEAAFTTIKEGDKWFVSLWYSVAEAARVDAKAPVPDFGNGLAARGADTPEAAVEQFIRAAVLLDVRRLIELTPPEEARALHDYAPLFIDAAEAGAREARKAYDAEVSKLVLTGRVDGNRALVKIGDLAFSARVPELGMSIDFDGTCATVAGGFFGTGAPIRQCNKGLGSVAGVPNVPTPDMGFVAVREGGKWYVSPTGTILDGMLAVLNVLEPSHLEMFKQIFGGFAGG
ncbi:MAG: hypothetical protein ACRDKS_06820 [Actinomycetota bacterium]